MREIKKQLFITAYLCMVFTLLLLIAGCQLTDNGAGYAAKNAGSQIFVSDRAKLPATIEDFLIWPSLTLIDNNKQTITARMLFSMRKAVYRDGLGVTLLIDMTQEELLSQPVPELTPLPVDQASLPWPTGDNLNYSLPIEVNPDLIKEAIDFAFSEPEKFERNRRTRGVAIVYDGKLIGERYAECEGFFVHTPQAGQSMTKSIINSLIGILVYHEKLDIYDPASVPEWNDPEDPRHNITIDQLLRMSSGLAFSEDYKDPVEDAGQMLYGEGDMGAYAAAKELETDPDTKWAYSSGTTNIIARIIRDSFDSLEEAFAFPRRALFDKIGMRTALIEPDSSGTFVGSTFGWASARDWARFGLLYLNDGVWEGERILPEGWVDYSTTPTPAAPRGCYGAQFWLNAGEPDNEDNRGYSNLPPDLFECVGYKKQRVTIIPSENLVVVRLGYTPDPEYWNNSTHEEFILKILDAIED